MVDQKLIITYEKSLTYQHDNKEGWSSNSFIALFNYKP